MKNKEKIILLLIILVIFAFVTICTGVFIGKGFDISEGIYLEAKNGSSIIVCQSTPIIMSNPTNRDLFENIDAGDKILIIHDGIAESYPARTGAYAVFKRNDGVTGAIPPSVIEELIALGWIDSAEDVKFASPSRKSSKN